MTDRATNCAPIYLTEVSEKDKPWDRHKANAVVVADHFAKGGAGKHSTRMGNCAVDLEMAAITLPDGSVIFKLRHTWFCRVRLCPVCQWRKVLKWRSRLIKGLGKVIEDYPKHRWIMLTLTVPNCDIGSLRVTLDKMQAAFVRLTKLKDYPGVGWLKSVEITRNEETDQAHPHLHILMMVPSSYFGGYYLKQADWADLWGASMRFSFTPIVHVKTVKEREHNNGLIDAIIETVKYAVKEEDLKYTTEWLMELSKQLNLSRSVTLGGVFRDYLREEKSEPGDTEEKEDWVHINGDFAVEKGEFDNYPSFDFGFNERKWRYLLKQIREKETA